MLKVLLSKKVKSSSIENPINSQLRELIQKVQTNIDDIQKVNNLKEDIPLFEKSLLCYESDINKARDTGHEYFLKLIENVEESSKDLETIKIALEKIKEFS